MLEPMLSKLQTNLQKHQESLTSLALLLVRVSVGVVFLQSGWGKLHHLPDIIEFFTSLGIPYPELQAPFVSGLELVGGALLIVGLGSRLMAAPLIGTMGVAIVTAKLAEVESATDVLGFIEWHYLVFFAIVVLMGPGKLSIDHLLVKTVLTRRAQAPATVGPAPAVA
jgi:putative oxidoreductase